MLNLVKPRYFVPIHGEYRMLVAHASLARQVGVDSERIFVMEDGDVLEVTYSDGDIVDHIDAGHIYVDGLRQYDMKSVVLRDRRMLARDGFVVVLVRLNHSTGALIDDPEVVTSGFVDSAASTKLLDEAVQVVRQALATDTQQPLEWSFVSNKIRDVMRTFLHKETGRRPLVIPVPIEV
jgi:ribonuclease J